MDKWGLKNGTRPGITFLSKHKEIKQDDKLPINAATMAQYPQIYAEFPRIKVVQMTESGPTQTQKNTNIDNKADEVTANADIIYLALMPNWAVSEMSKYSWAVHVMRMQMNMSSQELMKSKLN